MEEPVDDLLRSREPGTEVQEETPRPGSGTNAMTAVITQGLVGLALLLLVFLTPFSISVVEEIVAVGLLAYAFFEAWRAYRRNGTGIDYLRPGIALASCSSESVTPPEPRASVEATRNWNRP